MVSITSALAVTLDRLRIERKGTESLTICRASPDIHLSTYPPLLMAPSLSHKFHDFFLPSAAYKIRERGLNTPSDSTHRLPLMWFLTKYRPGASLGTSWLTIVQYIHTRSSV